MPSDYWAYVPRNPRHQTTETDGFRVKVERSSDKQPCRLEAELLDLSREGFRLRTPVPLVVQEPITLQLHIEESKFDLTLQATVRWQSPEDGETWLTGCLATRPVDWESLGELFINGILATVNPQTR